VFFVTVKVTGIVVTAFSLKDMLISSILKSNVLLLIVCVTPFKVYEISVSSPLSLIEESPNKVAVKFPPDASSLIKTRELRPVSSDLAVILSVTEE